MFSRKWVVVHESVHARELVRWGDRCQSPHDQCLEVSLMWGDKPCKEGLSYNEIVAGSISSFGRSVCRARGDEDDVGPEFDVKNGISDLSESREDGSPPIRLHPSRR